MLEFIGFCVVVSFVLGHPLLTLGILGVIFLLFIIFAEE